MEKKNHVLISMEIKIKIKGKNINLTILKKILRVKHFKIFLLN
jgi:hypothetical protein